MGDIGTANHDVADNIEPSSLSPIVKDLTARLDAMQRPIFATMEGAHFDNLPSDLTRKGIRHRSLFRGANPQSELSGPWFVELTNEDAETYVASLTAEKPCAVFWSCPDGEDKLFNHLRSLNEVLYPKSALPENTASKRADSAKDYARVLFRHWDPAVLGSFLPLLYRPQYSRVLGPAREVVMYTPDYGGIIRGTRRDEWAPMAGPLKIEEEQVARLEAVMLEATRKRTEAYLHKCLPSITKDMTDQQLREEVLHSEKVGEELGLTTERAQQQWGFLMLNTRRRVVDVNGVRPFISSQGKNPDSQVDELMLLAMAGEKYLGRP